GVGPAPFRHESFQGRDIGVVAGGAANEDGLTAGCQQVASTPADEHSATLGAHKNVGFGATDQNARAATAFDIVVAFAANQHGWQDNTTIQVNDVVMGPAIYHEASQSSNRERPRETKTPSHFLKNFDGQVFAAARTFNLDKISAGRAAYHQVLLGGDQCIALHRTRLHNLASRRGSAASVPSSAAGCHRNAVAS